jgi:hypothetical protein
MKWKKEKKKLSRILLSFKILNGYWSMSDDHENDPHKLIKTICFQDLISRSVWNNVLKKQKPKVQMWAMHNWFLHSCQNFDEILHDDVKVNLDGI